MAFCTLADKNCKFNNSKRNEDTLSAHASFSYGDVSLQGCVKLGFTIPSGLILFQAPKKPPSLWLGGLLLFFHKVIREQRNGGPPIHLFVSFLRSCTVANSSILLNLESKGQ